MQERWDFFCKGIKIFPFFCKKLVFMTMFVYIVYTHLCMYIYIYLYCCSEALTMDKYGKAVCFTRPRIFLSLYMPETFKFPFTIY